MRFLRRNRYFLIFAALLLVCGTMVVQQMAANQSAHADLRESFILLQTKGYKNEAQRLFQRLLADLERLPNKSLVEDYQRTLTLVDPTKQDAENLIWKYHWTVSNELERRSESALARALKLAQEP
jgi:excinuclease UvrABC helicase subunit UvrB